MGEEKYRIQPAGGRKSAGYNQQWRKSTGSNQQGGTVKVQDPTSKGGL